VEKMMNQQISDETIRLILSKVDIGDVIGDYVQLKKSGRNYIGLCPFHSEKTPSFSVSIEKQFYHCFGCNAGGNAISFLMDLEGHSFPQAVQALGDKAGIQLNIEHQSPEQNQERHQEKELVMKAHHLAAQLFHHVLMERSEGAEAREYLEKRGFQIETIKEFQLGFAPNSWDFLVQFLEKRKYPMSLMEKGGLLAKSEGNKFFDRFRNRIMFPIWDTQGNVIAFGGRMIGDGQPKYLNSPESTIFRKNKQLFNFHRSRQDIRQEQSVILFEGYVDVISAWQAGFHNVTASMGTSLSDDQARIIRRNTEQVILCYDGDQAGTEAINRAAETLEKQGCLLKVAMLPNQLDPDEYLAQFGAESFRKKVINEAKAFTSFRLDVLKRGRNLQDDGERMRYIREALATVSRLPHAIERDHYLRQLSEEFSLSLDALKQEQFQIYRNDKKKEHRDKGDNKWNNSINNGKRLIANVKQLLPAFHNAERNVLAHMLKSKDVSNWIEQEVGSQFNIDEHSALAAYLYSFYGEDHPPDMHLFLSRLQDPELIQLATQLSMMAINPEPSEKMLRDYVSEILSIPYKHEIEKKEEEKRIAERQGDVIQAALIATEILRMKKKI
jgi:DNA primase